MRRNYCLLLLSTIVCALSLPAFAAQKPGKIFEVKNPDMKLSPFTGMTRDHWKQAAEYLLSTAFQYVNDIKDPFNLPKQEGKSYPRDAGGVATARMEALCRTMFLAGPLLKENPDLTLHGIRVGDYYRYQMASMLDRESPIFLPEKRGRGNGGQKLVELGGLAVSLLMAPEVFWNPLPQETRDRLAAVFKTYAEGETINMNWRFFNQCLLSFLHKEGYQVNMQYMEQLLHANLDAYVGDGWYHDAPLFDYYSMWAFQMYGPLWAESFGKKYYPAEAELFMKHLSDIPKQYPYMFGRDGKMQMWGRSITYRMGAAIPPSQVCFKVPTSTMAGCAASARVPFFSSFRTRIFWPRTVFPIWGSMVILRIACSTIPVEAACSGWQSCSLPSTCRPTIPSGRHVRQRERG